MAYQGIKLKEFLIMLSILVHYYWPGCYLFFSHDSKNKFIKVLGKIRQLVLLEKNFLHADDFAVSLSARHRGNFWSSLAFASSYMTHQCFV